MSEETMRRSISARVARILQEERKKRGISMTALAEKAGLSQQMVSYVERNMRNPTLDTLLRITDAIGVSIVDVLRRAKDR